MHQGALYIRDHIPSPHFLFPIIILDKLSKSNPNHIKTENTFAIAVYKKEVYTVNKKGVD